MNKHKAGLALGLLYAACHAVWLLLVAAGAAKAVLDWVLSLHFISMAYTISSFQPLPAALLLAVAFLSGYSLGWALAALWNSLNRT